MKTPLAFTPARFPDPRFCFLLAACILASLRAASGAVIYRETFGRGPTGAVPNGNQSVVAFDWARFLGTGVAGSASGSSADGNSGKPTDLANVNAGPNFDGTFDAYGEGWVFMDGTLRLTMTTEFSFNIGDYSPGSIEFSWYQGNAQIAGVDQASKLAIRIGSQWYASAADFTNSPVTAGANFGLEVGGAEPKSLVFNSAAANWLKLNFDGDLVLGATPGTGTITNSTVAMSLAGPADADLAGTISGFGIYRDATGANARFDSFQIVAVPEPCSFSCLAFSVVGFLRRRPRGSSRSS
jgi:hypothetical protein